jgi:hypothetical protein
MTNKAPQELIVNYRTEEEAIAALIGSHEGFPKQSLAEQPENIKNTNPDPIEDAIRRQRAIEVLATTVAVTTQQPLAQQEPHI